MESAATDNDLERIKLRMSFIKFVLGTFLVGLLSIMVSCGLKRQELQILALEKENKQLEMFMNLSLRTPEERKAFALYFSTLARDEQLRAAWTAYGAAAEQEIKERELRRQEQNKFIAREVASIISADLQRSDSKLREVLSHISGPDATYSEETTAYWAKRIQFASGVLLDLIRADLEREDSKLKGWWRDYANEPNTAQPGGSKPDPP